jgi:hypothetical protein
LCLSTATRQSLHDRRCPISCTAPQPQYRSSEFVLPHFTIFVFTGATPVLMRFRDFQVLKSRRWLPWQIWVRGKSSGGLTYTVPRKLFRDFNLLCGVLAPSVECVSLIDSLLDLLYVFHCLPTRCRSCEACRSVEVWQWRWFHTSCHYPTCLVERRVDLIGVGRSIANRTCVLCS